MALAALGVLLVYAIIFWRERFFFADASFMLFRILQFDTLQIQEYRYGSFITQSFPLLAGRMGLSLTAAAFLYSISFNVFYLVVGVLLFYWRQYALLILLALYFTLSISLGFYWTNNEVHQGTAWMMLFFGYSVAFPGSRFYWPVAFLLCGLAVFTHPILILSLGSCWVLFAVAGIAPFASLRGKSALLPLVALVFIGLRFYFSKTSGGYDTGHLEFMDALKLSSISNAFASNTSRDFAARCITHYYVLPVLFLGSIGTLIYYWRWWFLIAYLFLLVAFWGLLCIAFDRFTPWYSESDWASFSLIVAIPFVLFSLPVLPVRGAMLLLAAIFLIRTVQIYQFRLPFMKRYAHLQNITRQLREAGVSKVLLRTNDFKVLEDRFYLFWELPVSVLILSLMEGDPVFRTVAVLDSEQPLPDAKTFLNPSRPLPAATLKKPFSPADTVSLYQEWEIDRLIPPEGID